MTNTKAIARTIRHRLADLGITVGVGEKNGELHLVRPSWTDAETRAVDILWPGRSTNGVRMVLVSSGRELRKGFDRGDAEAVPDYDAEHDDYSGEEWR